MFVQESRTSDGSPLRGPLVRRRGVGHRGRRQGRYEGRNVAVVGTATVTTTAGVTPTVTTVTAPGFTVTRGPVGGGGPQGPSVSSRPPTSPRASGVPVSVCATTPPSTSPRPVQTSSSPCSDVSDVTPGRGTGVERPVHPSSRSKLFVKSWCSPSPNLSHPHPSGLGTNPV